jgi:predicted polyphosphate/ATP-dependent NAD kinase
MKWAFIYTLDEPAEPERRDTTGSLVCIGVKSVDDAPAIARELVAEGVELIELCGGFGGEGLGAIVSAVGGRVPVGAVFYGVDASAGLQRLFGSKVG